MTTPVTWLNEIIANTTTAGIQSATSIIQLKNGNIVVSWTSDNAGGVGAPAGNDIIGQIYDPLGNMVGAEFILNHDFTANDEQTMDTAALINGGFIGVYEETNIASGITKIRLVELDNAGAAQASTSIVQTDASTAYSNYSDPHVAVSSATSVLVTYTKTTGAGTSVIVGKIYNPTANTKTGEIAILSPGTSATDSDVTTLTNGNYVITTTTNATTGQKIGFRILDDTGANVKAGTGVPGTNANGFDDIEPSVTALTGGGFVIAWASINGADTNIRIQMYDAAGATVGPVKSFGSGAPDDEHRGPVVVATADGGFVLLFDDNQAGQVGIRSHHIDSTGTQVGAQFLVTNADIDAISATAMDDGRTALSWVEADDIKMEILDTRTAVNSTPEYDDAWQIGTIGDDSFTADISSLNVFGWDGNDSIYISTLLGPGTIDGGDGHDLIDFSSSSEAGATFDLLAGTATSGDGTRILTITNFEDLRGTAQNDTLNGNTSDNLLFGNDGDDYLFGFGGNDVIHGDLGNDSLYGGIGNDVLHGDAGIDVLSGGDGNDLLYGGDENDFLFAGTGLDEFYGGADNDIIQVTALDQTYGTEIYDGGAGTDTINLTGGSTVAYHDFRSHSIISIERINFLYTAGVDRTILLDAAQFGTGLSLTSEIDGQISTTIAETFSVSMASETILDLSGLTFVNWDGANDTVVITGDADAETITGTSEHDVINGEAGNDVLNGDAGDDTLSGGEGNDILNGGSGLDYILGDAGDDIIKIVAGDQLFGPETYNGGADFDRLSLVGSNGPVTHFLLQYHTISSFEELEFISSPLIGVTSHTTNVTLNAIQLGSGLSLNAHIAGSTNAYGRSSLRIEMGTETSVDLSGFTFSNWLTGHGFVIISGDADAENITGSSAEDTIHGNGGNDTLNGGADADILNGNDGDDVIHGDQGDDDLYGGAGQDQLFGGDGDDSIYVYLGEELFGAEIYDGGAGIDKLAFQSGAGSITHDLSIHSLTSIETLAFGAGDYTGAPIFQYADVDRIILLDAAQFGAGLALDASITGTVLSTGTETLIVNMKNETAIDLSALTFALWNDGVDLVTINGDASIETIKGTQSADKITGGAGNDTLDGFFGDDELWGDGGGDTIDGNAGNDTIHGGDGVDTIHGDFGNDILFGDVGDDWLYGGLGEDEINGGVGLDRVFGGDDDDTINGEANADILHGDDGNDVINGGAGSDRIYGENGDDILNGGDNNDSMFGHAGNDTLNGDNGNDVLWGYSGDDLMNGGADNDTLHGGQGFDVLNGNDGDDTLNGNYHADDIFGGLGNDILNGGAGFDALFGDDGDDTLNGDEAADNLWGLNGADTLNGGIGNDILYGGAQQDILDGGGDNDTLHGGGDTDTFVFTGAFGKDEILDFAAANAEKIDLSGVAAITGFADLVANHLITDASTGFAMIQDGVNTILLNGYNVTDFGAGLAISDLDFVF